jgi:cytochrome c5
MPRTTLSTVIAIFLLTACTDRQPGSGFESTASRSLRPAEPQLAEVYDRSCRSCHTVAGTGAPLTGDAAAWAPRLEKGMNILVDNVINGLGSMPPGGLCRDCDADQYEQLIAFMAAAP